MGFPMASIPGLKKVGAFWHYNLKVNGQRAHGSTRATDLATAKKILEEKRREFLEGQYRIVSRIPTLDSLVQEWLKAHRTIFSLKHRTSFECIFRRWIAPALGSKLVDQIGTADVLKLRADQLDKGCSPRYSNNALQVIKLLCNFALKLRLIKELPFNVPPLRLQKKPRATVSAPKLPEFLRMVDEEARNPHVRILLCVMVGLGLREGEALGMRWEWFDPEHQTYTVGKAKGKEARVLPVPDWMWSALHTMPQSLSLWVFPAEDGNPHRSLFCRKTLKRVCERLGLGNVTQHRLRATVASLHAEAGTPLPEIQGMLAHKDIATTMIYVEQSMENKRRAQEALSQKLKLA